MAAAAQAQVARVEGLLERLESLADADARETALAVVRALLELYGEGLGRIVEHAGPAEAAALAEDDLVAHLLLLHGLHPVAVERRVQAALDSVRPYLDSHGGDVELVEVRDDVARVRLRGSCHGCPASETTLRLAIEDAVLGAVPDVERVEAEGVSEPASVALPVLQAELAAPGAEVA